jgi:hypothetical protein
MLGKIKKVFFSGVFGILYISFIAQLVYVIGWLELEQKMVAMGALALEWLVIIAARYLSKRSGGNQQHGFNGRRR